MTAMRTLRVNLVDLEIVPAGPGATISGTIWAQLTHLVRTTDGQVIGLVPIRRRVGPSGIVDFRVPVNDGAGTSSAFTESPPGSGFYVGVSGAFTESPPGSGFYTMPGGFTESPPGSGFYTMTMESGIVEADRGFGVVVGWDLVARDVHGVRTRITNWGTTMYITTASPAIVAFPTGEEVVSPVGGLYGSPYGSPY